jgi:hypothetical protein
MRKLPAWLKGSSYGEQLIASHYDDTMDEVVAREIDRTLFWLRFRRHSEPFVRPFIRVVRMTKFAWEVLDGRYRRARSQVHGGPNPAPGGSAGTGGFTPTATQSSAGATLTTNGAFEDAGIRAGEVTAHRCWILRDDGLLHSMIMDYYAWAPGIVATGDPTDTQGGVHAFKTKELAQEYGRYGRYPVGYKVVFGTVDLWGDVFEHERGYRASKAAIASIDDSPDYDAVALRKLYKLNRKPRKKKK